MADPYEIRSKMRKTIEDAVKNLGIARRISDREALEVIHTTYIENLERSLGTSMEEYWQSMLSVASEMKREYISPLTPVWNPSG